MWDKFLDLLEQSIIVQSMIALMTFSLIVYLYATGKSVAPELWQLFGLIVGFYFGSKSQYMISRRK